MKRISTSLIPVTLIMMAQVAYADSRIDRAKELFIQYVALEKEFDPALADLYSDDAVIRNTRKYPNRQVRAIKIPAKDYKSIIRTAMPLARALKDRNTYSRVSYGVEGDKVRIRAIRYAHRKKYTSPISLLVGPDEAGEWLIFEEISESRP